MAHKEPGTWKHRGCYGTGGACFGYCPWRDEKCNECFGSEWKKVKRADKGEEGNPDDPKKL
jgi:hypothetical protein